MKKINKILIANRGEIALRVIRACKELEIQSLAIYSEVDAEGVWVKKADESMKIDPKTFDHITAALELKRKEVDAFLDTII